MMFMRGKIWLCQVKIYQTQLAVNRLCMAVNEFMTNRYAKTKSLKTVN